MEIGVIIPKTIQQGDTVKFTLDYSEYLPADGWGMKLTFMAADHRIVIDSTDNGDGKHLFTISSAVSGGFKVLDYRYQLTVTDGTDRYTLDAGPIGISADFSAHAYGMDTRTQAARIVDAIDATLEGRATSDQESYTIKGRSLAKIPVQDLLVLRSKYKGIAQAEEKAERIKKGLGTKSKIRVRFS